MGNFDRYILLTSLSIFFAGLAFAMININMKQKENVPRSVMVSPTAASMVVEDPRPKAEKVIRLCYSADKFVLDVRMDKRGTGQRLVAKGMTDDGEPLEIYAAQTPGGAAYAVYVWNNTPGLEPEVCRIVHGEDFDLISAQEAKAIDPAAIPEPAVQPEEAPLPVNPPDYLGGIGQSFELQSVPEGGPATDLPAAAEPVSGVPERLEEDAPAPNPVP